MTSKRDLARDCAPKPLIAIASNSVGDIAKGRRSLIEALQRDGYRIAALVPERAQGEQIEGVDTYRVPMNPKGLSPIEDLATLLAYRKTLRRIGARAFLGFTIKPNLYGSMAARTLGLKRFNNITGLGVMFARKGPLAVLVRLLYRAALTGSDTVFFQNCDDRDLFVRSGLVKETQATVLPGSGVDLNRFKPAASRQADGQTIFLLAGRLLWDKGVREFVAAARALRKRRSDLRFQILGMVEPRSPDAVAKADLERWTKEGVVDYLGSLADVRPAFAAADCIVLPSYYREGVPRVLLEGAAMAKPLITADSPGCRDAVDDGITGLLCAPRSTESLMKALERFASLTLAQRKSMSQAGRKKMERAFDERIVHRAYLKMLDKAFAQPL
jgi:glycosyltransferase involved in cell wall biosynthesis